MSNSVPSVIVKHILPFKEAKAEFERAYIHKVLTQSQGNMTEGSVIARKDRKDFYTFVKKNGIDYNDYR